MSKKTISEFPDLDNIWKPPSTTYQQNADTRVKELSRLSDNGAAPAYRVPWSDTSGHASHLEDASEDFRDALWSTSEGKRDVRSK